MGFDGAKAGQMAPGLSVVETAGAGKMATWQVVEDPTAPSKTKAFGITRNENYGHTFNLVLASGPALLDLDVSVMVRAVAGSEDQGGGPLWRAKDKNNYYVARWNPLENNFRVYFVKDGRRKQLKSVKTKLDPKAWHKIRVVMRGPLIECFLDGKKLLTARDTTFKRPGAVGLWVKADGKTLFDDLKATEP